jgi:hypothetical protein
MEGVDDIMAMETVNNLGILYTNQGRLDEGDVQLLIASTLLCIPSFPSLDPLSK